MNDQAPITGGNPGKFRWVICGLLFFSVAVNYLDRLVLAILKKDLCRDLGWSDSDYGWITAAFSFAYAFGYLLGGGMMDRWGVKKGLPIFVILWSCSATAHGLCGLIDVSARFQMDYPWFSWAEKSLVWMTLSMPMTAAGFMLARIALGLTEGGNFPGAIKAVAEWYPVKERALATGLFNSGTNVGAILCPIAVPWLYLHLGWESTFYITGATGFIWVVIWWRTYDSPEDHKRLSSSELAYIQSDKPVAEEKKVKVPWLTLFRHRPVWAYVFASILAGPAWGFYQFFVPDFLDKRFGIETQELGWWTGAFFAIAAVGGVVGGWLAGRLLDKGWSVNAARKVSLLICALAVVPVFLAPFAGAVWLAVLIVGIAGSAHQGWTANLFCVVSDTMPKQAISSVVGLGGFVSYFTGGFVNGFTGEILKWTQEKNINLFGLGETSGYLIVFAYFSLMYLLSLGLLHLLVPRIERETRALPMPEPLTES
ncbi:MFS transporter [Luteolibacter arcticus]|uniref:MFS transporter n=1 Tax=Luteolibacter arcticus TaxID=1581411 RepID=A0ABT3GN73_9BACT|nr:MFS transporter [Luteolibacter arcticus]MCW1924967.1 MFS transporter [Luteolibacter arcticus]